MVEVFRPERLEDALYIRGQYRAVPFAGGTDLMVKLRRGAGVLPKIDAPVLFLDRCGELRSIHMENGTVEIGAATILSDLIDCAPLHTAFRKALQGIGAPAIRNTATIGGNICNASPAGDTLPFLYAVDARVKLRTAVSERLVPIDEFIVEPGKTTLTEDEIVVSVLYDVWNPDVHFYRKVGTRRANALTKVSFLGLCDTEGGQVRRAAITLGAVGPTAIRLREVEGELLGSTPADLVRRADTLRQKCIRAISPIDDQRSTRSYRSRVSQNLLTHFIERVLMEHLT